MYCYTVSIAVNIHLLHKPLFASGIALELQRLP